MHAFRAMGAALLMAAALPATGQADGMPPGATATAPKPGCHCPPPHRAHHAARRHRAPVVALAKRYWASYDMRVPSPWDSGYDRAMVLNYRTPAVNGERLAEGGYPPTPPVAGAPYFWRSGPVVYQYDGMADGWVPLSQHDAQRFAALAR